MPYIKYSDRDTLADPQMTMSNAGELNYMLTKLVDEYMYENGKSYKSMNDIVGALECAKLEIYRRIVGPYEDKKIAHNGDVYSRENLV